MIEIDVARHSHLIDPQLHVWGWEIPSTSSSAACRPGS